MAPADPVRENVEASLRRLVGSATAMPCGLARATGRALTESAALVRTMVNLTVGGLLGWDIDAGVPRVVPATERDDPIERRGARGEATPTRDQRGVAVELAIPGYEDLAASHIVARLDRLTRSDLAQIRSFEVSHRGRRTVVGKIDQLLARP